MYTRVRAAVRRRGSFPDVDSAMEVLSAQLVSKYGLRKSSKTSLSTGVLKGNSGQIRGFVQFAGPGSLLTNPALLAGAAGIMAQVAMQQTMDEIIDYLATIDEKLDDVLRAQEDAVCADMIGVGFDIDEAMAIRERAGRVNEVTWSKVQATSATIANPGVRVAAARRARGEDGAQEQDR